MSILDGNTSKDKNQIYEEAISSPPDIVGEPFKEYVDKQIQVRQKVHGSGFRAENPNNLRSKEELVYLNSRNAWVRMASSVKVGVEVNDIIERKQNLDDGDTSQIGISQNDELDIDATEKKLQDLGLPPDQYQGIRLAKEGVLFNGIWDIDKKQFKSGVASSPNKINNSIYGFGGNEFGLQPIPGITSFEVGHLNIGSIRSATVNIRAHNKFQFDLISLLYIRLGFTMLIEWGNGIYMDNDGKLQKMGPTLIDDEKNGWFNQNGTSHLEFFNQIEAKRKEYNGNYDALFGKVSNLDYSFETDGSYSISLTLVSLGDVVESFNLNTFQNDYKINISEAAESNYANRLVNLNNILNRIYCIKNYYGVEYRFDLGSSDEKLKNLYNKDQSVVTVSERTPTVKGGGLFSKGSILTPGLPKNMTYITFKLFLDTINELITYFVNKSTDFPMLTINTSEKNYCKYINKLVSFNPNVCVVNYGSASEVFRGFKMFRPYADEQGSNPYYAKMMNIYLSTDYLESTIQSIINSNQGILPLFRLLDTICNDINESLAHVTQLKPTLQDDNIVVIRDFNLDAKTGEDGNYIDSNSTLINLYGVSTSNGNQSNFIKSFNFSTTISKDFASMMSIGATSAAANLDSYHQFFSNLNRGLVDRFKESSSPVSPFAQQDCGRNNKPRKKTFSWWKSLLRTARLSASVGGTFLHTPGTKKAVSNAFKEETEEIANSYSAWLANDVNQGEFEVEKGAYSYSYFNRENGKWDLGKTLWDAYLKGLDRSKDGSTTSLIGFIPFSFDLILDGIAGMKIYNQLVVDTSHFPSGYPKNIELIITGIDHKIENNSWTTQIRTQTKPSGANLEPITVPIDASETGDGFFDLEGNPVPTGYSVLENMDDIFDPNGQILNWAPIESDAYTFLSSVPQPSRSIQGQVRDHFGVDIAAREGLKVYSVTDGVLRKGPDNPEGWGNNFVYVEQVDPSERLSVDGEEVDFITNEDGSITTPNFDKNLFHIYGHLSAYREDLVGKYIQAGTEIGRIGDVGSPGSYHLHYEIRKGSYTRWNKKFRGWKNPVKTINEAYNPSIFPTSQFPLPNSGKGKIPRL